MSTISPQARQELVTAVAERYRRSTAVKKAEARAAQLAGEIEVLRRDGDAQLRVPTEKWIIKRVTSIQQILERRTCESAHLLRRLLGKVVLEPTQPDHGKAYYVAHTAIDTFVLLEPSEPGGAGGPGGPGEPGGPGGPCGAGGPGGPRGVGRLAGGSDSGSGSLGYWRRRESNPRPRIRPHGTLHAYPRLLLRPRRESAAETAGG